MRKMKMTHFQTVLAAAGLMFVFSANAHAQIQVGTRVGEPRPVDAASYDSLGRRDPFVSLILPKRAANDTTPRASRGLSSFMLADVVVTGISRKGTEGMAILQGSDRQSYVARVNDKIADAIIKRIDAQGVVFLELPRPGDMQRPQETRKPLRSVEVIR
jgi:Tfp pilus assembly protein PilP